MNVRDVVKNAPNWVIAAIVAGTIVLIALIGAQVALTLNGDGSADLTMLLNNVYKLVSGLAAFGGLAFGAAAAKSAHVVEKQITGDDADPTPPAPAAKGAGG